MKKSASLFSLMIWMIFLPVPCDAQSSSDSTRSVASNELPSLLAAHPPPEPRATPEPYRLARPHFLPPQQFACSAGITLEKCRQEMLVLRKILANYRASDLGEWTWVLVRSEDWRLILLAHNLNPGVPALTALGARTTFFEEALVDGPPGRVSELMDIWHADRDGLLNLAVRHELGHALCTDENERKADHVARLLEQKKPAACEGKTDAKQKSSYRASSN